LQFFPQCRGSFSPRKLGLFRFATQRVRNGTGISFSVTKGPKVVAKLPDPEIESAAQVVALFSVLIHAWQYNDFSEAARVQHELNQRGIKVRILRRRRMRTEPGSCK
jgi:hypothetical protein